MTELTSAGKLSTAWRGWNHFLKANGWVNSQQGMIEPACMALQRLGRDTTKLTATDIDTIVMALGRAVPQIRAANRLQNATWKSGSPTEVDIIRFLQLRLIMITAGFEVAATALVPQNGKKAFFDLKKLGIIVSSEINMKIGPVQRNRILDDWLRRSDISPKRATLDHLFQLRSDTLELITNFLEGKVPNTVVDAIKLARALRHAVAHGALSPTKVKQFKLVPAIDSAAELLMETVAVLLEKMVNLNKNLPTTP